MTLALARTRLGRRLLDGTKAPATAFATRLGIAMGVFSVALPASLAVMPRTGVLRELDAEPHLQGHGDLSYSHGA